MTTAATADTRLTYLLAEACDLLGLPYSTGKRLVATTGELVAGVPCFRVGRRWHVQKRALDVLLGTVAK